ncbi:hypothetical protein VSQ32_14355 [Lachnospiraceae bacterium KK002]
MKLTICTSESQLDHLKRLYLEAFPAPERKPFPLLLAKSREGLVELLAVEGEDDRFLGLAVTVLHKDMVLLDYFAIVPGMRGQNAGSKALRLLKKRYPDRKLILEIEDPEEESDNREERMRRKAFYIRNNMVIMPCSLELFGIKMLLLTSGDRITFGEYREIYEAVFPGTIADNIKER